MDSDGSIDNVCCMFKTLPCLKSSVSWLDFYCGIFNLRTLQIWKIWSITLLLRCRFKCCSSPSSCCSRLHGLSCLMTPESRLNSDSCFLDFWIFQIRQVLLFLSFALHNIGSSLICTCWCSLTFQWIVFLCCIFNNCLHILLWWSSCEEAKYWFLFGGFFYRLGFWLLVFFLLSRSHKPSKIWSRFWFWLLTFFLLCRPHKPSKIGCGLFFRFWFCFSLHCCCSFLHIFSSLLFFSCFSCFPSFESFVGWLNFDCRCSYICCI